MTYNRTWWIFNIIFRRNVQLLHHSIISLNKHNERENHFSDLIYYSFMEFRIGLIRFVLWNVYRISNDIRFIENLYKLCIRILLFYRQYIGKTLCLSLSSFLNRKRDELIGLMHWWLTPTTDNTMVFQIETWLNPLIAFVIEPIYCFNSISFSFVQLSLLLFS